MNFPTSQRIEYQYDGSGRLKKVIDPAGRQTGFAYQGDQLSAVFYPDGTSRSFAYGSNQLLQKEVDARGFETTYHYNAHMRLSGVTKADGAAIHFEDQVSSTIAPPGEYTTQALGGFGFDDPSKSRGTFTNPMSAQTQAITDQNGNVAMIKDAANEATVLKYNDNGDPDELITANGQTLRFVYNMATRDHLETWEVLSETESKKLFTKTYNSKGQMLTLTNDQGITTTNTYHPTTGLLVRTQKGVDVTDFGYDSRGLLISQTTYPSGSDPKTTQFVRNAVGQVVRILTPEGKQFDFTLDAAGNAIEKIESASGNPSTTQYVYDSMNRLKSTISPKNEVTEYHYLPTGELESIVDAKGNAVSFEYDQVGRVTKRTNLHGGVHTMQYDLNGNVIRETDPKGQIKILTYDSLNRLKSVQYSDDTILYNYDAAGRMTSAQNNVSRITYAFDERGKLQALTSIGLGELSGMPVFTDAMVYNQNDRLIGRQSTFGSVSYGVDQIGRLTTLQTSSNLQFSFGYNNRSQLTSITRNIGRTDIQYTGSGSIENMIHSVSGVTRSYSSYMYDERLFTKQKRSIAGQQDYSFDLNGQLTESSGPVPETFVYDSLGNRVSDQDGTLTYDEQASRLLGDSQFTYQYDLNGNLIAKIPRDPTKTAFHYTYSSRNQLMEVKTLSSALGSEKTRVIFRYDALGRRVFKQVIDYDDPGKSAIRKYVFRGSNVLAELDGQNQVLARYTHSPLTPDDILAVEFTSQGVQAGLSQSTGAFFYLKDSIGSVTDLMNQSGQIVQRYTYGAFGNIWSVTDESGNSFATPPIKTYFAFAGREWDEETGMYYNRARYYDPKIGRFIQEDPHPGSQYDPKSISNRYA